MEKPDNRCSRGNANRGRSQTPRAVNVTSNARRRDSVAMRAHSNAVSQRCANCVTGPCVDTNDPRGAGKKNSATTLISTMAAVSKFANRMSMEQPQPWVDRGPNTSQKRNGGNSYLVTT